MPKVETREASTQVLGGEIDTAMSQLLTIRDMKIESL